MAVGSLTGSSGSRKYKRSPSKITSVGHNDSTLALPRCCHGSPAFFKPWAEFFFFETLKRHETTGVEEAAFLSETTCDMKRPKDPHCLHSAAKHGNLTKCSRGNTTGQATTGNDNRTDNGTCGGVLLGVPALVFDGDQRHTGDTVVTLFHHRRPFAKRLFTESLRPPVA